MAKLSAPESTSTAFPAAAFGTGMGLPSEDSLMAPLPWTASGFSTGIQVLARPRRSGARPSNGATQEEETDSNSDDETEELVSVKRRRMSCPARISSAPGQVLHEEDIGTSKIAPSATGHEEGADTLLQPRTDGAEKETQEDTIAEEVERSSSASALKGAAHTASTAFAAVLPSTIPGKTVSQLQLRAEDSADEDDEKPLLDHPQVRRLAEKEDENEQDEEMDEEEEDDQDAAVQPAAMEDQTGLAAGTQESTEDEEDVAAGTQEPPASSQQSLQVPKAKGQISTSSRPPAAPAHQALGDCPKPGKEAANAGEGNSGDALVAALQASPGDQWGREHADTHKEWLEEGDTYSLDVGDELLKMPRDIYKRLYLHQRQAVTWMWGLHCRGFGGLLADEMGLGKTVQAAAFLTSLKCSGFGSRFMIIVPVALLAQWRRELTDWGRSAGIAVHVYHGSNQERAAASRGLLRKGGAFLVSYDLLRTSIHYLKYSSLGGAASAALPKKRKRQAVRAARDDDSPSEDDTDIPAELDKTLDADRPWDVVIIDEGHRVKDPSCIVGRALRKVAARSRFLLTGTPLQNKLSDLWALMDLVQPGLLGNHATFERNFSEQIAKGSKRNATRYAVELKDHLARELKRLTAPHFLRRMKADVAVGGSLNGSTLSTGIPSMSNATGSSASNSRAPKESAETAGNAQVGHMAQDQRDADGSVLQELPPKTEVVLWLSLTQAQLDLYNLLLGSEVVRRAQGQNKCGMEALRAIAMLKKLCNHPLLCLPKEEFLTWRNRMSGIVSADAAPAQGAKDDAQDTLLDDASQPAADCLDALSRLRALQPDSVQGAALLSCKLRVLSVLLPQLQRRGHRCLIFSHSTLMLDLIQVCVLKVLGLRYLRIDGTVEAKDRDSKLKKFHEPDGRYFCVCLSTQVGGVGLTITAADRVILVDPAWNPAMDAQAIDRVHRIGQTKEVVVYRLLSSGAIEDKMFRLQVYKRGLANTAFEQEHQIRYFTHKELKQLFEPPNESASTQSLMAEKIGTDAQEHEDLLKVVVGDIGGTDDPQAVPFWQSPDVLGFSDYQRLFMFVEQLEPPDKDEGENIVLRAKNLAASLQSEEYMKDQVVAGTWRGGGLRGDGGSQKENSPPAEESSGGLCPPLQDSE